MPLLLGLVKTVNVVREHGGEAYLPWIIGAFMLLIMMLVTISTTPKKVALSLSTTALQPSWRKPIQRSHLHFAFGHWVSWNDTSLGMCVHLGGLGGLSIAGKEHSGQGYAITRRPTRNVDLELSASQLDALLTALGATQKRDDDAVRVDLVRSKHGWRGVSAPLVPVLLSIMLVTFARAIGLDRIALALPHGESWQIALLLVLIAPALLLPFRSRAPSLVLCASAQGLSLLRPRGAEIATVSWPAVQAAPRNNLIRSRYAQAQMRPALELSLGARKILLGCMEIHSGWQRETRRGTPRFWVSSMHWVQLLSALRRNGVAI